MSVIGADTRSLTIVVDSLDDVLGPVLVSPASYAIGWTAIVRSPVPFEDGRVFVVSPNAATGDSYWNELLRAGSAPTPAMITQTFSMSVPVAGSSVADQTLNLAVVTDPMAAELRLAATYLPAFQLQPDSSLPLFQYATFLLTDPGTLPNGTVVTLINCGDPDVSTRQSSIALRLPNGSPAMVNHRRSDISVHSNLSAGQFVVLQAGGAVQLSVDRSDPLVPRYWIRSLL